jgi:dienelactone hydrolase
MNRILPSLICLALVGCLHLPMDRNYAGPQPLTDAQRAHFAYPEATPKYTLEEVTNKKGYAKKRITFNGYTAVDFDDHTITIDYYDIHGTEPTPVIVVLPILGGSNDFAKIFARYFAKHGIAALIVHRQDKYKDEIKIDKVDELMKQIVLDHMQAIDWVETQPDLDTDCLGVFGISMGGIKAALLAGTDDRVDAAAIALGAGDLPYVLTHSKEPEIEERLDEVLEEKGMTRDELQAALEERLTVDPLTYAPHIDAARTLMILAAFDNVVPIEKGRELRRAAGKPKTTFIASGHYSSIAYLPFIRPQILRFFRRQFADLVDE